MCIFLNLLYKKVVFRLNGPFLSDTGVSIKIAQIIQTKASSCIIIANRWIVKGNY